LSIVPNQAADRSSGREVDMGASAPVEVRPN
jgi:hypothetical protein